MTGLPRPGPPTRARSWPWSAGRDAALMASGAVTARLAFRLALAPTATPPGVRPRTPPLPRAGSRLNFRGRPVSLAAGPALAVAAGLSGAAGALAQGRGDLAVATLAAGWGAGLLGRYDDLVGDRPGQPAVKGLRGHLGALASGRLTSGAVKMIGLAALGLVASASLRSERVAQPIACRGGDPCRTRGARRTREARWMATVLGAGVVAGTANLLNLLDLRPGRALKAGLVLAMPLLSSGGGGTVAGPVGAAVALLPADLGERAMLGDCGANAWGAVLGVTVIARLGPAARAVLLGGLVAVTLASERTSLTSVIEATAGLRQLDRLGRLP